MNAWNMMMENESSGFGFFAGIVGAHNGMMAYGKRTGQFHLERVNSSKNFQHLDPYLFWIETSDY